MVDWLLGNTAIKFVKKIHYNFFVKIILINFIISVTIKTIKNGTQFIRR